MCGFGFGMVGMANGETLMAESFESGDDKRVVNNVMRHEYRVLTEAEKADMQVIKDLGLQFHTKVKEMGNSRALSIAATKIEEAVMWAVKHITSS